MATFVERIDSESNYTKVFNVIKLGFKDGEIFNRQLVTENICSIMKHKTEEKQIVLLNKN